MCIKIQGMEINGDISDLEYTTQEIDGISSLIFHIAGDLDLTEREEQAFVFLSLRLDEIRKAISFIMESNMKKQMSVEVMKVS